MKKLHFIYRMHFLFSAPIMEHSFTLKCIPMSNEVQQIQIKKKEINPKEWLSSGEDSFQNSYLYGKIMRPHDSFFVSIEGEALVERTLEKSWRKTRGELPFTYHFPTALTECSGELEDFAQAFQKKWCDEKGNLFSFFEGIHALMEEIYASMEYRPGTTNILTSAAEAFAKKSGVCQDYAHIMIAVLKKLSFPAVYIAGYMIGEGASHAWVGVYNREDHCWYEIDPTNDKWVDDTYIIVSHGLDSQDCVMNKGIYKGNAAETQTISVIVEELPL